MNELSELNMVLKATVRKLEQLEITCYEMDCDLERLRSSLDWLDAACGVMAAVVVVLCVLVSR